jgi:hypothetical protein
MKRAESVIATTFVDTQGDQLTREALENLVESISRSFVPIGIEHDPRIPPFGRIASGFVRQREDGEYEAVATMELFEEEDEPTSATEEREIVIRRRGHNGLHISHDWSHRFPEDQADIDAIAEVFRNPSQYDFKKAAEPISVITIAGAFVLGGIASGFLKEIGSDGWKLVKPRLAALFSRPKEEKGEQLLSFNVLVEVEGVPIEIDIIHTNPSADDVSEFLEKGLTTIDAVLPIYIENAKDIRRLVFEAKGKDIEVKFAVRKDCRPLAPSLSVRDLLARSQRHEP